MMRLGVRQSHQGPICRDVWWLYKYDFIKWFMFNNYGWYTSVAKVPTWGIPFILVSNLSKNTVTYDTDKFISAETYKELYKRTPIEIGDILLSTVGSYGHPAVVVEDRKFLFQRHIAYLKPKSDILNSYYMHGALLSPGCQRQIEEKVKG